MKFAALLLALTATAHAQDLEPVPSPAPALEPSPSPEPADIIALLSPLPREIVSEPAGFSSHDPRFVHIGSTVFGA